MKLKACKCLSQILKGHVKAFAMLLVASAVVATFPVQFVKAVSIEDGVDEYKVYTFTDDARSILSANKIDISESDAVEVVSLGNGADSNMKIKINRAFPVKVELAGKTETVETTDVTVRKMLSSLGFVPDEYDEIYPSLETKLQEGMTVSVTDVDYTSKTVTESIDFKTEKRVSKNLKPDESKVLTEGQKGKRTVTTITKTVNGKVADKSITQSLDKKPQNRVIEVGAVAAEKKNQMSDLKPKKEILLDKNGVPVNYKKKMTGMASAYCTGTTCSTGVKVKQGYIAIDPNIIPYGTEMYIRTPDGSWIYGYSVAADTGGFTAWGNTIADLYMYSYNDAVNFGRRNIEIYIL